jgi:hypothetical protein
MKTLIKTVLTITLLQFVPLTPLDQNTREWWLFYQQQQAEQMERQTRAMERMEMDSYNREWDRLIDRGSRPTRRSKTPLESIWED